MSDQPTLEDKALLITCHMESVYAVVVDGDTSKWRPDSDSLTHWEKIQEAIIDDRLQPWYPTEWQAMVAAARALELPPDPEIMMLANPMIKYYAKAVAEYDVDKVSKELDEFFAEEPDEEEDK